MTTSLFFSGLQFVPLAEASAIMLISPLIVTALAMPILKEPVGSRRWTGVGIGFIGALIIIRPGSALISIGILFPAAAAISFAIYQISTRLLSQADPITTTLFYTALVGTLFTSAVAPFYWTPPTSGETQVKLFNFIFFLMCLAKIGVANKLSTGISKKP